MPPPRPSAPPTVVAPRDTLQRDPTLPPPAIPTPAAPVRNQRNPFERRDLWLQSTQLDRNRFHDVRALWMMLACKMAYVTTELTLDSYKDAIGATSVERITFDDLTSPYGLKITYPDIVVFAVQGTTTVTQFNRIVSLSGTNSYHEFLSPNTNRTAAQKVFGKFHGPSWEYAQGWFGKMEEFLATEESSKRWYVAGHSLGAAIWQCVLPMLESHKMDLSLNEIVAGDGDRYENWNYAGGYAFGCPLVRQMTPNLMTNEYVGPWSPQRTMTDVLSPRLSTFSRSVIHYQHPFDPIPLIPAYASLRQPLWWQAIASAAQLTGNLTDYTFNDFQTAAVMHDQADQRFYDRNAEKVRFPTTLTEFKERMAAHHYINFYIDAMKETLVRRAGQPPENWATLIDLVRSAPQDEALPDVF